MWLTISLIFSVFALRALASGEANTNWRKDEIRSKVQQKLQEKRESRIRELELDIDVKMELLASVAAANEPEFHNEDEERAYEDRHAKWGKKNAEKVAKLLAPAFKSAYDRANASWLPFFNQEQFEEDLAEALVENLEALVEVLYPSRAYLRKEAQDILFLKIKAETAREFASESESENQDGDNDSQDSNDHIIWLFIIALIITASIAMTFFWIRKR